MTVTAEDGATATSDETAPVTNDKSAEIKLVDKNGLQTDGTALPTDELVVDYGADLGTPSIIIWYCNGAAKAVYSLSSAAIGPTAFSSNGLLTIADPTLAEGEYWVTIENTAGQVSVTNVVTVALEDIAVMSDVSIEDDYDSANMAGVNLDKTTSTAILNVTFNKNYGGKLYLIDSKIESSYAGHIDNVLTVDGSVQTPAGQATPAVLYPASLEDGLTEVKTLTKLTNKEATAKGGVYYEDATGAVRCKIPVDLPNNNKTVTRGADYYLVWDQEDVEGDEITATATRADLNTSDDMTVPYVNAPDSLVVSSFATGSDTVKVDALDENGEKLAWYTDKSGSLAGLGLTAAKIYKVNTNAKSSTDSSVNVDVTATTTNPAAIGTPIVDKGTYTFKKAATIESAYVYVKLTTVAGVFAAGSLTLESELSESARDALTSISLKEDSADPTSAVVEFKGLSSKAPGKVYIMQGNNAADEKLNVDRDGQGGVTDADRAVAYKNIAGHDLSAAIGEADVEGGAASVTIPNVFEAADMEANRNTYGQDMGNDAFVAVFVPEDEELWKRATNLNADGLGFRLTPSITTIDKSEMTATLKNGSVVDTSGSQQAVITIDKIQAIDQFGNKWVGTAARNTDTANVDMIATTVTNDEVKATVAGTATPGATVADVNTAGVISFDVTVKMSTNNGFDKGDGIKITVANLKNMTVTITAKDVLTCVTDGIQVGSTAGVAHTVAEKATLTDADAGQAAIGTLKLSDAFSIS